MSTSYTVFAYYNTYDSNIDAELHVKKSVDSKTYTAFIEERTTFVNGKEHVCILSIYNFGTRVHVRTNLGCFVLTTKQGLQLSQLLEGIIPISSANQRM